VLKNNIFRIARRVCDGDLQWSKLDPHQDDDTCPNYRSFPPRHPQLSESIPKPLSCPAFSELPSIPKTFLIRSRVPPFQGLYRSNPLPLRSPHLLWVFSTPRPSPSRRPQLWTWTSNNRSSLISTNSYATPSFLKNPYQCGQLWTVTDFPACNPNLPTPMITVVITNSACVDHAVTIIHQFCPMPASMSGIYYPSSSRRRESRP